MQAIDWFRRWLIWRKGNGNSRLHQYLVLVKIVKSPTMDWTFLPEEWKDIELAFYKGALRGLYNDNKE